jgi:hypothetical protein
MSGSIDITAASELLRDVGFLLVPGPPLARGPAYLLVCLRAAPTLEHFDPERIDYWITSGQHGVPASIDRTSREPPQSDHSWGTIRVVDRLDVSNEFASFGGSLLVERVARQKVVVFNSDAPIVARGGHSQQWAAGSMEISGFLARLQGAADPRGTMERQLASMSPVARYASFVADRLARLRASEVSLGWSRADRLTLLRERRRLQTESPLDWAAGEQLCASL